ncbi:MAG: hypothetical protein JNK82_35230 [Myxococcaceae bacterium]|nr:hypothetical protein [Myxococcaceae bacterium]
MSSRTCAVLVSMLFLGGCGVSYCDRQSICPNDPIPTPSDRQSCHSAQEAHQNSPCYREALAHSTCAGNNVVCGDDGKTNATLTATKVTNNCKPERDAQTACCNANANASACTSGSTSTPTTGGNGPAEEAVDEFCKRGALCRNDPVPTAAERSTCTTQITQAAGTACFTEVVAARRCINANVVCNASGRTDGAATVARIGQSCAAASTAAQNCCSRSAGSPSCV